MLTAPSTIAMRWPCGKINNWRESIKSMVATVPVIPTISKRRGENPLLGARLWCFRDKTVSPALNRPPRVIIASVTTATMVTAVHSTWFHRCSKNVATHSERLGSDIQASSHPVAPPPKANKVVWVQVVKAARPGVSPNAVKTWNMLRRRYRSAA